MAEIMDSAEYLLRERVKNILLISMFLLGFSEPVAAAFPATEEGWWAVSSVSTTEFPRPENPYPTAEAACERTRAQAQYYFSHYGIPTKTVVGNLCIVHTYYWDWGVNAVRPTYFTRTMRKTTNECPQNSELINGSCTCKSGFLQDAENTGCYKTEVIEEQASTKPNAGRCPRLGNPILPLLGSKVETVNTGLNIGATPLVLTYDSSRNSAAELAGVAPKSFGDAPAMGGYWFSSLHRRARMSSARFGANIFRGDGSVVSFRYENGGYLSDKDVTDRFSKTTAGYQFIDSIRQSVESYDKNGNLLSVADAQGNQLSFIYSTEASRLAPAAGYLMAVNDGNGRTLKFEYELPVGGVAASDGRIARIIGPTGQVIAVGYDSTGNLLALNWEDGRSRQFLYETSTLPWALTGVVDENGSRLSTFQYDDAGRAISTERAGGVDRYSVSYGSPPMLKSLESYDDAKKITLRRREWAAPLDVSVTATSGQTTSLNAVAIEGVPVLTSSSQPAGSGCASSSNAVSFDGSGNALSRDDFRGQRICYVYDNANRETVRVEGLAAGVACSSVTPIGASQPAGARKITTTWHPDWRKPSQVSEPSRNTTMVYHSQPDPFNGNALASCTTASSLPNGKALPVICKQVEQALLGDGSVDAAVPAKATSFTYDSSGRVLSETDANAKVRSYSYYAATAFTGNAPGSYDPEYDAVTLLLRGNGDTGSQTVVDEGSNQLTVGVNGDAQVSTARSMFGGGAIAFDGAGDYLLLPYNPSFAFGSGDFTIETYLYKNANGLNASRVWGANGDNYDGVNLSIDSNGNFGVYLSTTSLAWNYSLPTVANLADGQWYHLAVVRSGGSVFAFVNGIRYTVTASLGTTSLYSNPNHGRVIGGQSGVDRALNGYIDDFRITRGKARYTQNFTPPTQEFISHGLILSSTDVGHTIGDLQSITNPAGHVTQFTQYDRAGRVRQMIDPKGVVTDISYTPRGWVSTVTTTAPGASARTTTYTYDGVGQLRGVAQPDGTTLSYSYDAAHRLVGVTDAKGNSVAYTLDNSGNRIAEEIKDPTGVLQRSIGRSFDALNRVQQVTGATR